MLEISITAPAIFVYVQMNHDQIHEYQFSKNGFIQTEPLVALDISYINPNCTFEINNNHFKVLTVNDFLIQ